MSSQIYPFWLWGESYIVIYKSQIVIKENNNLFHLHSNPLMLLHLFFFYTRMLRTKETEILASDCTASKCQIRILAWAVWVPAP